MASIVTQFTSTLVEIAADLPSAFAARRGIGIVQIFLFGPIIKSQLPALKLSWGMENLGLGELAEVAGLTKFQLIGLFKRTVGLTPHAYLIQIRLNAACRLLRRGFPLAESALAAGFCDQSALSRHFKRCYGITPAQFASATRAG
jgi:AraC-like DNA-binding protein